MFAYNELQDKPLCEKCNVILVSLDTLGSNHLPCYGYERNTAPNLCKFAKENIMFSNSYSNAPWTLPSHFSIFTSLYPKHHGVLNTGDKLNSDITTLPQIFKSNWYSTVYVGPTDDAQLPLDKGLERGFDLIYGTNSQIDLKSWENGLNKLKENTKNDKNSFLFLHSYWVHAPYVVESVSGQNKKRLFTDIYLPDIPLTVEDFSKYSSPEFITFVRNSQSLTEEERNKFRSAKSNELIAIFNSLSISTKYSIKQSFYFEQLKSNDSAGDYARALYDETIYYLDKNLRNLFDLVQSKQFTNNTILIITSDHGEEFMEHGYLGHPADRLYNSVTSVPLIMYIPGIKQMKIDKLVEGVDIFPTVLSLIGVKAPASIDGVDLTGIIQNKSDAKAKEYLISEGISIESVRNQAWKLYRNYYRFNTDTELYDLISDPDEKNDIDENKPINGGLLKALDAILYKNSEQ